MVRWQGSAASASRQLAWKLMTGAAIACLAAGCTKTSKKDTPQKRLAAFNYSKKANRSALQPNNPVHIATAHWAKKHQKNPADAEAAINYARNLKALGSKSKALEVLSRTYQLNANHTQLASEYGRLALDMGQTQTAEQLLNIAHRGKGQTDWRVLSALGTVSAKRGDHPKAQQFYLAALKRQPGATSIYNNLALSYALDGKVGQAEQLLKNAVAKGHNTRKVRQNLALVLGLQSKFGEAQQIAKADLDENKIDNNVTYLRQMVKKTQIASAPKKVPTKRKPETRIAKAPAKADKITTAALPKQKTATSSTAGKKAARVATTASLPQRKPVTTAPKPVVNAKATAATKPLPWTTSSTPTKVKSVKSTPVKAQATPKTAKKPEPVKTAPAKKNPTQWSSTVREAIVKPEAEKIAQADTTPKPGWNPFNNGN